MVLKRTLIVYRCWGHWFGKIGFETNATTVELPGSMMAHVGTSL